MHNSHYAWDCISAFPVPSIFFFFPFLFQHKKQTKQTACSTSSCFKIIPNHRLLRPSPLHSFLAALIFCTSKCSECHPSEQWSALVLTSPVLPLCVVDGRSRNPLYYYHYYLYFTYLQLKKLVPLVSDGFPDCSVENENSND